MFRFINTEIEGLYIIEPQIYGDHRGYFCEMYKKNAFDENRLVVDFVQDNESRSKKGVLRGLHFQIKHPQAKLVRVIEGEVFDVAVDLRKNSPTYGKWVSVILSSDNKRMLFVPKGFAHGFLCLSETATFFYKCDEYYHPEDEGGIIWDDPDIGIIWPKQIQVYLSEKDKKNPTLKECKMEFDL